MRADIVFGPHIARISVFLIAIDIRSVILFFLLSYLSIRRRSSDS